MRAKKRTSKRTSTKLREGIKKKASAKRRKERKVAKTDPTWRSRVSRDPGIPSSFPYKDKIINDLEEQRRIEKEKREQMKLERQQAREEAIARGETGEDIDIDEDEDDEDDGNNGLSALLESAQQAAKEYEGDDSNEGDDQMMDSDDDIEYEISMDEDEDEFDQDQDKNHDGLGNTVIDKSRKAYDKIFKSVVDQSDVILYVLDARDPESTRSKKVEEAVLQSGNKRLILLLNKVDLIPTNALNQWLNYLKSSFPTVPIKASPGTSASNFNKNLTSSLTANQLLQSLKTYSTKANLKRSIIVGVIGYPNVGKSSIINALTNRIGNNSKACPVGNQAGVTTSMREIKIDNKLKILDSPGIVFPDELFNKKSSSSKINQEAKLALLSALPPKQIMDPIIPVNLLLKKFSKNSEMADGLKQYYNLPSLPSSNFEEFSKHFLIHIARTRGRLGKGGIPNLDSAAQSVLNDWRDGKILGWTLPNASKFGNNEETDENAPKSALRGDKEPPKSEQTTVVTSWAQEFDLDGLLNDNFGINE